MKLHNAYEHPEAVDLLWRLLAQRESHQSIGHKKMPTYKQHCAYIESRPNLHWYLIDCGDLVGAARFTADRRIGIEILREFRGNAYGKTAVVMLQEIHGLPLYADINPMNRVSMNMFVDLGYVHVANTFSLGSTT